jgi:hypothetical protein
VLVKAMSAQTGRAYVHGPHYTRGQVHVRANKPNKLPSAKAKGESAFTAMRLALAVLRLSIMLRPAAGSWIRIHDEARGESGSELRCQM